MTGDSSPFGVVDGSIPASSSYWNPFTLWLMSPVLYRFSNVCNRFEHGRRLHTFRDEEVTQVVPSVVCFWIHLIERKLLTFGENIFVCVLCLLSTSHHIGQLFAKYFNPERRGVFGIFMSINVATTQVS